jgi:FAD dependent oxidoreductase
MIYGMGCPDGVILFCFRENTLTSPEHTCHRWYEKTVEVYPRPDGSIYICGIGGSDYISTKELKQSAFLGDCPPKLDRVEAATKSFRDMASTYETIGLAQQQACMRPCPPDSLPYMGELDGCDGAFINAGHNCWYVFFTLLSGQRAKLTCFCLPGALRGRRLAAKPWRNWWTLVNVPAWILHRLVRHGSPRPALVAGGKRRVSTWANNGRFLSPDVSLAENTLG